MGAIGKTILFVGLIGGGGFVVNRAVSPPTAAWQAYFETSTSYDGGSPCNVASIHVGKKTFAVVAVAGGFVDTAANESEIGHRPSGHGKMRLNGAREVPWSYSQTDGKLGTVTIDGRRMDLEEGGLFLVYDVLGTTEVEQRRTMPKLALGGGIGTKELEACAGDDLRVGAFLAARREGR